MKKKKLDIAYTFDFELHGVITSMKGYKLAWEINRKANVSLKRMDDFEVEHKEGVAHYLYFAFDSDINHLKLLKNKPQEEGEARNLLVPDHPRFDFFIFSSGEEAITNNRLQEVLRDIPSIELVAFIPLAALKSKENFIF